MSHNDITGDRIKSRVTNDNYAKGYDAIFGKKASDFPNKPDGLSERRKLEENLKQLGIDKFNVFPGTDRGADPEKVAKEVNRVLGDVLKELAEEGEITKTTLMPGGFLRDPRAKA